MGQRGHTKDEKFLIALYELAKKTGEMETVFDCYYVGSLIGQSERMVTNIVKLLAQTNFIKKQSKSDIHITPHGQNLVETLLKDL